jgi:hypothetical protein
MWEISNQAAVPAPTNSCGVSRPSSRPCRYPVVYTPGDNEWTDCHRPGAGRWDPRERLARLREIFFADPAVLRLAALGVIQADERYPEIYGFVAGEVLFVALHVVGSDNGLGASYAGSRAEFESRDAVNRAFLSRMLASPAGQWRSSPGGADPGQPPL